MRFTTRFIIFIAMVLLSVVSMYTTYASLRDSILPTPTVSIPLGANRVWECSVFALGLSVAIGLMLFGLKVAIIDEQKKLNISGLLGLIFVGFISIAFNIDVLYRTADRDFFIRYENNKMRGVYEDYLAKTQTVLTEKRNNLLRQVATQEGELESEVKGLRAAPQGYGERARQEDYHLTVLKKTTEVDLQLVDEAIAAKQKADEILAKLETPTNMGQVMEAQDKLRGAVKDVGGVAGVALPDVVKPENPFFAVFQKLFDWRTVGFKEIFIVMVGFLLDLGDIIGYSMVPNRKKQDKWTRPTYRPSPDFTAPETVPALTTATRSLDFGAPKLDRPKPMIDEGERIEDPAPNPEPADRIDVHDPEAAAHEEEMQARKPKPFRFGRR